VTASYPRIAPASGASPLTTGFSNVAAQQAIDANNTNDVANYAWVAADSVPASARVATTGGETYTIVSGSVTTIGGTTIDDVTVAVNDLLVIKDAPLATGPGLPNSTQPGNGFYYVVSVTSNITVARAATMSPTSAQPNPAGRGVFVRKGGTANGSTFFQVTTPSGVAAFIYGTTALAWTGYPLLGAESGGGGFGSSVDGGSASTVYGGSLTIDGGSA
jgi:hypothetical protein